MVVFFCIAVVYFIFFYHFQTFFIVLNMFLHLTHMLILLTLSYLLEHDRRSVVTFLSVIFTVLGFKKKTYLHV